MAFWARWAYAVAVVGGTGEGMGIGGTGVGGVEDGIIALDQNVNDDLAMEHRPELLE